MEGKKEDNYLNRINKEFTELINVVELLRGPQGCPWDKAQTRESLSPYLLQETYELIEAILTKDDLAVCEELGDVLLQVVLHSQLAKEKQAFDIGDVCRKIKEKLLRRHPHIFAEGYASNAEEVSRNWEAIKRQEGKGDSKGLLDRVPRSQPALLEATEMQRRAKAVGFDWADYRGALEKIEEELAELKEAITNDPSQIEEELGDLIFATVNLGRFFDYDGEIALKKTNEKFRYRFASIEKALHRQGLNIEEVSLEEMDALWEECKKEERN